MPLSNKQVSTLIGMVTAASPDTLDCDGCFQRVAEFAEAELTNREIPAALKAVQVHLSQCGCCKDEYKVLLESLRELRS
jgi:hypothetical protein